ncbi:cyclopropane-fatty-acyl-phospholipid synthase family protein [Intrasporangium mesophilum]
MTTVPSNLARPICLRRPSLRPFCLRAAVARHLVTLAARRVPVDIALPDGTLLGGETRTAGRPLLEIVRPAMFFERVAHSPKIGIGEGYMAGDWRAGDGTDLADLLLPFAERVATALPPWLLALRSVADRAIPDSQRNSPSGSRRNIEAHYDLSNDLFATFLDETMTYSSALFDRAPGAPPVSEQPLATAQRRKVGAILDTAGVTAGTRLLEIGTGWGELAVEAAGRGASVTTVTLSTEQAAFARHRVATAGLSGLVDVRVQDYREVQGRYDAIVSVEMVEAVGEEFWPTYFAVLDERLAPGGVVAIQSILMSHERYLATRGSYGWIQKHIFPGGLIPSRRAIDDVTAAHTTLRVTSANAFGPDYATTLRRWREAFAEAWPHVRALGFDETFCRMWELYLAYSEAGFASGYLAVAQLRLERPRETTPGR